MKKHLINAGRWIGVLPAALVASILAYLAYTYGTGFFADDNSKYSVYVAPVIGSLFSGMAFLLAGVTVAPLYKTHTALALLIFAVLIAGAGIFVDAQKKEYLVMIKLIAATLGTIISYVEQTVGENKNKALQL